MKLFKRKPRKEYKPPMPYFEYLFEEIDTKSNFEGGTVMSEISKEKREWMESVGIKEFKEPMKFYIGTNYQFSEDYIKNTPLEVLKERFDESLIHNYKQPGTEIFKKDLIENSVDLIKTENVTSNDELLNVADVVMAQLRHEARRNPDEPKPEHKPFNAEDLLKEQMKLVAEASNLAAVPDDLCNLTSALCDLYKTLNLF